MNHLLAALRSSARRNASRRTAAHLNARSIIRKADGSLPTPRSASQRIAAHRIATQRARKFPKGDSGLSRRIAALRLAPHRDAPHRDALHLIVSDGVERHHPGFIRQCAGFQRISIGD